MGWNAFVYEIIIIIIIILNDDISAQTECNFRRTEILGSEYTFKMKLFQMVYVTPNLILVENDRFWKEHHSILNP